MITFKPNEQRAKAAQITLLIIAILYAVGLISSYFEYQLVHKIHLGIEVDTQTAEGSDLRQRLIAIMQIVGWLASGICFILWFRRAYYNLNRKVNLKYTDGWAAGAWFVPLLNLWRPFYMIRELYLAANLILQTRFNGQYKPLNRTLLGLWWAAWLIDSVLGRISYQMSSHAESLDSYLSAVQFDMFTHAWTIVAALLALKVVRNFATIEPLLYQEDESDTKRAFDPEVLDS